MKQNCDDTATKGNRSLMAEKPNRYARAAQAFTRRSASRPGEFFDPGLQQERTQMAWERTAIATIVNGLLLTRYGSEAGYLLVAAIGMLEVATGGVLLIWAGSHYEELHGPLRDGLSIVHPTSAKLVGLSTIVFIGAGLIMSVLDIYF